MSTLKHKIAFLVGIFISFNVYADKPSDFSHMADYDISNNWGTIEYRAIYKHNGFGVNREVFKMQDTIDYGQRRTGGKPIDYKGSANGIGELVVSIWRGREWCERHYYFKQDPAPKRSKLTIKNEFGVSTCDIIKIEEWPE